MQVKEFKNYKEAKAFLDKHPELRCGIPVMKSNTVNIYDDDPEVKKVARKGRLNSASDLIIKDIEPYQSPLGNHWVTSRRERREELKSNGLREIDPSEFKPEYKNERFIQKHGLDQRN